jgi:hypothetical protein
MREISTELEKRIEGQKQQKKQQVKSWELFKTVSEYTLCFLFEVWAQER